MKPINTLLWAMLVCIAHTTYGQSCVKTAPYTENFDGNTWVSGAGSSSSGQWLFNWYNEIDTCWNRPDTLNPNFGTRTGHTGSYPFTGPSSDVSGPGNYIFTEMSGGSQGTGEIESPLIYIPSSLSNPHLSFGYHMAGRHIDSLVVEVDAGNGYSRLMSLQGAHQYNSASRWLYAQASLSSFTGDTLQIRFKGSSSLYFGDIAIDNFSINTISCNRAENLVTTPVSTSSVSLAWQSGGASNWQIEYGPAGFTPGTGTFVSTSSNPHVVNGLGDSITYEFYVRDSCGVGQVGFWSKPIRGGTLPNIISAPWFENFDGAEWVYGPNGSMAGNAISNRWTRNDEYTDFGVENSISNNTTGPNTDISGTGSYLIAPGQPDSAVGTVISPWIYIPDSLHMPQLKFNYHIYGWDAVNFRIRLDTGTGFLPQTYALFGRQQINSSDPWVLDSISLDAFSGDTLRIMFIGASSGIDAAFAIDEVSIASDLSTYCASPDSLVVFNIGVFEATLIWQSAQVTSDVELLLKGQSPGSGLYFSNLSSPYTFTGLIPDTTYIVRLQDSCKANAISSWELDTFKTQACPAISLGFNYNANLLNLNFDASASINSDSLYWDFGDGTNDTGMFVQHVFAAKGTYIVTLNGFSVCDSLVVLSDTIQVCDSIPDPKWTYGILGTTSSGMQVQFTYTGNSNPVEYHWDFGDGTNASGTATPQHTYQTPGLSYIVTLVVENECGDKDSLTSSLQGMVSLKENSQQGNIEVFPNPSEGYCKVVLPFTSNEIISIHIIDNRGTRVFEKSLYENSDSFELDFNLPAGIYQLSIITEGSSTTQKLLIK